MGDFRRVEGITEHEVAPGVWERVALDQLGKPILGIRRFEDVEIGIDEEAGRVVFRFDNDALSFPADVGVRISQELAAKVPEAAQVEVAAQVEAERVKLEKHREETLAAIQASAERELAEKQAEIAQQVAERRAELEELEQRIEERKGEADAGPALPKRP